MGIPACVFFSRAYTLVGTPVRSMALRVGCERVGCLREDWEGGLGEGRLGESY